MTDPLRIHRSCDEAHRRVEELTERVAEIRDAILPGIAINLRNGFVSETIHEVEELIAEMIWADGDEQDG